MAGFCYNTKCILIFCVIDNVLKQIGNYSNDISKERVRNVISFVLSKYAEAEKDPSYPKKTLEIILPMHPDEETLFATVLFELYANKLVDESEIFRRKTLI